MDWSITPPCPVKLGCPLTFEAKALPAISHSATKAVALCILLVEDEFVIRALAHLVLVEAGYEVLEAQHGQAAFDHLNPNPSRFTCLLTDYHMPGQINGGHVLCYMRQAYATAPMILASGFPHATTPEWRKRFGVELLPKPYEPDELIEMVTDLLRQAPLG